MGTTRNGSKPQTGERGTSGASSFAYDSLLSYGKQRTRPKPHQIDRMLSEDGWASAIEGAQVWPIRSLEWSVEEADGDTGEAEEVRAQLEPLADKLVAGMSSAIARGVAFFEQVWGYRGGRVVLEDIVLRPAEQCEVLRNRNGRPIGFRQRAYVQGRGPVNEDFLFADRKAFVFFHDEASRPGVGVAALTPTYHNFEDNGKRAFYQDFLLEKYAGPSTHVKTHAEPGTPAWRAAEEVARDMRSGAGVVTDPSTEIAQLLTPNAGLAFRNARRDAHFESAVSQYVQNLALAESGNSGAYALSRDHSDLRTLVADGRVKEQDDRATAGPVADIVFWNYGPGGSVPSFNRGSLSEHVTARILAAAETLFASGHPVPDWIVEGILERYGPALGIDKPEGADEPEDQRAADEAGEQEGSTP